MSRRPLAWLCPKSISRRVSSLFVSGSKRWPARRIEPRPLLPRGTTSRTCVAGRSAVLSNAPILRECGIDLLPGVQTGITDREQLRAACSTAACGITGADYALADTGTLVMLSSQQEARLISLLPPVYIALVARERLLTGLDELLTILPHPAEQTSSMVLITGPSRTADIEQILVRGVHGPGEIHVVVV